MKCEHLWRNMGESEYEITEVSWGKLSKDCFFGFFWVPLGPE